MKLSSVANFFTYYKWILLYLLYVIAIVSIAYLLVPLIGIIDNGNTLSLIQTAVDLLVVVPTIVIFIWQIASIQSTPIFDLRWEIQVPLGSSEISLELPQNGTKTWSIQPVLTNTGNAVTPWYLVSFLVPAELLGTSDNFVLHPVAGKINDHWKIGYTEDGDLPGTYVFTFLSNGQIASYPNYDLVLARLEFSLFADREYQNSYEIKYVITSDKGKRQDKVFTLKTHKENVAKKISAEAFLDSLLRSPRYGNKGKSTGN